MIDFLNLHNNHKPKEITLDYETYENMLKDIEGWKDKFKKVLEDKTHVLVQSVVAGKTVISLVETDTFYRLSTGHSFVPTR